MSYTATYLLIEWSPICCKVHLSRDITTCCASAILVPTSWLHSAFSSIRTLLRIRRCCVQGCQHNNSVLETAQLQQSDLHHLRLGMDYGSDSVDREPHSSNAMYVHGDLVAWFTNKQLVAHVSFNTVEYIAVSYACEDGPNIFPFMNQFAQVSLPIHVYDNQEATRMPSNLTKERSKRMEFRHHLIRDYASEGMIKEHISTEHNTAEIMTKPLRRLEQSYFTNTGSENSNSEDE